MGFKTIDLDAPGGYDRYNKMKKTNSVKKAFEDETVLNSDGTVDGEPLMDQIERKNEEVLNPVIEEALQEALKETPKVEEKSTPTQDNIVRTGVVKGVSQLRVRTKPEGDVMFLISENSVVKILEDHDGWWFVETAPDRRGYVMKAYIQVRTEGG